MRLKQNWIEMLAAIAAVLVFSACNRNIGPVPEDEPEYDVVYFSGEVSAPAGHNASGVLFVAAGPLDGGPPPLVARYNVEYWPTEFLLTNLNQMMRGAEIQGPMRLFARFDTDGDVNTRGPLDLEIRTAESFELGTKDIRLQLKATEQPTAQVSVTGTIQGPTSDQVSEQSILFVFLKDGVRPMPLVARRYAGARFPLQFELNDMHLLMKGAQLPEQAQLEIRLDADGDPMTKSASDWYYKGELGAFVRTEPVQVKLTLGAAVQ